MMDFIRAHVVSLILSALGVGGIAFMIVQWMKRTFTGVDDQSTLIKRLLVSGVCLLLAIVCTVLGLPIPCDVAAATTATATCLANIDPSIIEKILTVGVTTIGGAIAAYSAHAGKDSTAK